MTELFAKQFTNLTALFVSREIEFALNRQIQTIPQTFDLRQVILTYVLGQVPSIYHTTEAEQIRPIDLDFLHQILGRDRVIQALIQEGIQYFLEVNAKP